MEDLLRMAMREAYSMGVAMGEMQAQNAELRATIATLNDKLRAAEGASYTVNVCGIEATD